MSDNDEARICRPCGKPASEHAVRCVRGDRSSGWVDVRHPDCYSAHLDGLNDDAMASFASAPA